MWFHLISVMGLNLSLHGPSAKGRESGYQVRALSFLQGSLPQWSSLEGPQVCGHYFHKVTTYLPGTVRLTLWWEESSCWPQRALMWFRKETRKSVAEKSFLFCPVLILKARHVLPCLPTIAFKPYQRPFSSAFFHFCDTRPTGSVAERERETVMDLHMGGCMQIINENIYPG